MLLYGMIFSQHKMRPHCSVVFIFVVDSMKATEEIWLCVKMSTATIWICKFRDEPATKLV
jgi:hypothetical protein